MILTDHSLRIHCFEATAHLILILSAALVSVPGANSLSRSATFLLVWNHWLAYFSIFCHRCDTRTTTREKGRELFAYILWDSHREIESWCSNCWNLCGCVKWDQNSRYQEPNHPKLKHSTSHTPKPACELASSFLKGTFGGLKAGKCEASCFFLAVEFL